jgi:fructose-specific component phosphotransferase system IIB-like protein
VSTFSSSDLCAFIILIRYRLHSASRVRQTLIDHIRNTTKVVDAKLMSVAKQLIPLVEALVAKLYSLADINRAVHTPTYNRLIAAAVDGDEAMAKTD